MRQVAVVGGGSWGTALARVLAAKGEAVRLWAYEAEVVASITKTHQNQLFLPDILLPEGLQASTHLAEVVPQAEVVVLAAPSHVFRHIATQIRPFLRDETILVSCTKGIEVDTGRLMSQVLEDTVGERMADRAVYLSGPTFAREVALEQPSAVVMASRDQPIAAEIQSLFRTPYFLPFLHHDVIGVEVGGALKNVFAIAAGIVEGMGFGHNTRAALITRGLYEMIKLGKALGAEPLTFTGLSGIGDLVLTCTGALSRNRQVGVAIGQGTPLASITQAMRMVAEGVLTTKAVHRLITEHRVNAPICHAVYDILYAGKSPQMALHELTTLELKEEQVILI